MNANNEPTKLTKLNDLLDTSELYRTVVDLILSSLSYSSLSDTAKSKYSESIKEGGEPGIAALNSLICNKVIDSNVVSIAYVTFYRLLNGEKGFDVGATLRAMAEKMVPHEEDGKGESPQGSIKA